MKRSLLDTDIFSDVLKGKNPVVASFAKRYRAAFPVQTISAITVMEIVQGFHKKLRSDALVRLGNLLDTVEVLEFDRPTAELAGRIFADLERKGSPIGRADPMIAATALQHRLTLVTANSAHFLRIQALGYPLDVSNWRDAASNT